MAKRGSEEWKNNIRQKRIGQFLGKENPFWGKKHTQEVLEKNRQWHIGKPSWNKGKKLHYDVWDKGKHLPKWLRVKISESLKGRECPKISNENHYLWKGDEASYKSKHSWINKRLGQVNKCEICGTTKAKRYEWHNKDKKYKRNFKDWQRLCTSCHHNINE